MARIRRYSAVQESRSERGRADAQSWSRSDKSNLNHPISLFQTSIGARTKGLAGLRPACPANFRFAELGSHRRTPLEIRFKGAQRLPRRTNPSRATDGQARSSGIPRGSSASGHTKAGPEGASRGFQRPTQAAHCTSVSKRRPASREIRKQMRSLPEPRGEMRSLPEPRGYAPTTSRLSASMQHISGAVACASNQSSEAMQSSAEAHRRDSPA